MSDTTLITIIVLAGGFLFFLAAVHHYTQHSPFPPESWLVIAGVIYSLLQHTLFPAMPTAMLQPEVVLMLLLPILVFASGRSLSPRELHAAWLPIAFFAVPGVILTMLIVGLPLAWLLDLPWSHGLMFGAAVAATDPTAVNVIFHRFPLPERLALIIDGESLFNDGTAIVLFGAATALALGTAMVGSTELGLQLLWSVAAAIPIGLLLGWLLGRLILFWHEQNRFVGLSMTLILCYGTFMLAEHFLHLSGVITVLCAALAFTQTRCGHPPDMRDGDTFHAFWDYLNTLGSGILFFSLGATVGHHAFFISWVVPGVIVLLLLSRAILVYGGAGLLRFVGTDLPLRWQHIMMLGGLRGAVSAALVLLIPADYPYRIELVCLVFILIMFTLLLHPPLLRHYLQRAQAKDRL